MWGVISMLSIGSRKHPILVSGAFQLANRDEKFINHKQDLTKSVVLYVVTLFQTYLIVVGKEATYEDH